MAITSVDRRVDLGRLRVELEIGVDPCAEGHHPVGERGVVPERRPGVLRELLGTRHEGRVEGELDRGQVVGGSVCGRVRPPRAATVVAERRRPAGSVDQARARDDELRVFLAHHDDGSKVAEVVAMLPMVLRHGVGRDGAVQAHLAVEIAGNCRSSAKLATTGAS